MSVEMVNFIQKQWASSSEYSKVEEVLHKLLTHLNKPDVLAKIELANQPTKSSREVQDAFLDEALELGFKDESKVLFANYHNKALRPVYYLAIEITGIILEVERGKTTTNNMDFLDFWKCHICEHAHYLFLMVPKAVMHGNTIKKEFNSVQNRLGSFFVEGNYTNVRRLSIFGY